MFVPVISTAPMSFRLGTPYVSNQIIFYARTCFATPPFVPHVTESSIVCTNLVIFLRRNHSRN